MCIHDIICLIIIWIWYYDCHWKPQTANVTEYNYWVWFCCCCCLFLRIQRWRKTPWDVTRKIPWEEPIFFRVSVWSWIITIHKCKRVKSKCAYRRFSGRWLWIRVWDKPSLWIQQQLLGSNLHNPRKRWGNSYMVDNSSEHMWCVEGHSNSNSFTFKLTNGENLSNFRHRN